MAYWQNGKLYLHGSTQSVAQTVESVARWVGVDPAKVVMISEYTGGGFGSKIPGAHTVAIPALLARKAGAPVMMRISREEEHYIGRTRPDLLARVKIGLRKDGRITAVDIYVVQDAGPYEDQYDLDAAPGIVFACLPAAGDALPRPFGADQQPAAHVAALAGRDAAERDPGAGAGQGGAAAGHRLSRAARMNAPAGKAPFGPAQKEGRRSYVTSAFVREALDKGAELFKWNERKTRSRQRRGAKVRGVGVSVSPFIGGYSIGYDGLLTIRPDGRLYVQSGAGNLGTHSVIDVARVAGRRSSTCPGTRSRSCLATPARTCRGPARRTAARRSMR